MCSKSSERTQIATSGIILLVPTSRRIGADPHDLINVLYFEKSWYPLQQTPPSRICTSLYASIVSSTRCTILNWPAPSMCLELQASSVPPHSRSTPRVVTPQKSNIIGMCRRLRSYFRLLWLHRRSIWLCVAFVWCVVFSWICCATIFYPAQCSLCTSYTVCCLRICRCMTPHDALRCIHHLHMRLSGVSCHWTC